MLKKFSTMILLMIFVGGLAAQNVGDPAPEFALNTSDGGTISLSDYKGKVVYLFFFGYD